VKLKTTAPRRRPVSVFELPGQHLRLSRFPLAQRINAQLAQKQRFGFRQHLESRQVVSEGWFVVQIHVKADKIHALGAEKLRGWIIAEGAKAFGVNPPGLQDQLINKIRHRFPPAPANQVGRNLVDHAEGENGGMPRAGQNRPANGLARLLARRRRVEK
jgi:hypothetical protein